MNKKRLSGFSRWAGIAAVATLGVMSGTPHTAHAATTNRYATDDHGNFMMFGNTSGFDCRDKQVERPVVGNVPYDFVLGLFTCNRLIFGDQDSGIDLLWRSQYASSGAGADATISPSESRSTAILALPAGAKVVKARLYWAAQRNAGQGPGTSVNFDRPGGFARTIQGEAAAAKKLTINGLDYYQSSTDVTSLLQANGSGAYRVGNIQTIDVRNIDLDVGFVAWNIVVFYHLDSEPVRNMALFDGLERVSTTQGSTTTVNLNGFTVPANGFSAKLGVIAYEGDNDITGDQLKVNGTAVSNTYNPVNNFFNRSSTVLNQLAPRTGDLPQMSGRPSSMSGYDSDVIDITGQLTPGITSFRLDATTSGDEYFLGVFATAVSTIRPVFSNTVKTVTNIDRSDGRFLPGDTLEYTITTTNTGNDIGKLVTVTDALPAGVTYRPGTLVIKTGTNMGTKTDAADNDQAEYVAATRTVTFRLGTGANGTTGGDMAVDATASVAFRVTIDANATGTIVNQGAVSSVGKTAQEQGATTPIVWPSGSGGGVNVGTPVVISTCATNADCPNTAPICDLTKVPPQCVCRMDSDCMGGRVCSPTTKQCVECIPGAGGMCNPNGAGGYCLPNNTCGCQSSTDCAGRVCDTSTGTCAAVNTDLSLTLTRTPAGTLIPPGTPLTYTLTVANNGQVAINGATIDASLAPNLPGAAWTCMGQGGAVCPAAQGTAPLSSLVNVPAGGKLVYTFTATTSADPVSSTLDFTAAITPPRGYVDTNPADNVVTDSLIVGIPPLGPDLSITVTEVPSETDNSVDYIIQVTNHGPGVAPGATVTYDVPPGAEITITAGTDWSCERTNNNAQVVCRSTMPIPVGDASPIRINVKGEPGATTLPVNISVTGTDGTGSPLSDPNPADNTIMRTTTLGQFGLAGGGLFGSCDCSLIGSSAHPTPSSPLYAIAGLFGLALLVRSARRSRQQASTRN
ncbi:MAG: hypothetical protein QM813_18815 [Verrucomicrobiota bacterium]